MNECVICYTFHVIYYPFQFSDFRFTQKCYHVCMAKTEEDTLIEDNTVSFLVYFKGFFLIILVIIGMILVNRLSNRPKNIEQPTVQSATQTSLIALKQATTTYIEERVKKDG